MLFKSIQLHNFGRYRGTSVINTGVTAQRNVVLINGGNDRGKTTLLTAIKFVLFGERQDIRPNSLINYQQADHGGGNMYVEIIFEHNEHEYRLRRSVEFRQTNIGDEIPIVGSPHLEIFVDGHDVGLNQEWLDHLLPMDVSQFFIFDGEQIQSYINKAATSLKEPIEVVLGIKELLNAQEDIKEIIRELDDARLSAKAAQSNNQNKLAKIKKTLSDQNTKLSVLNSSIKQAKHNEKKFTAELDSHTELKRLNEDTKSINSEIKDLENKEKNCIKNIAELRGNLGLFLLRPLLQLVRKANLPMEEWEIVAAHNILEGQRCVCGRQLDAESIETLNAKTSKKTHAQYKTLKTISKIMAERDIDSKMNEFGSELQKLEKINNEMDRFRDMLLNTKKKMDAAVDNEFDFDYAVKKLREAQGDAKRWEDERRSCIFQIDKYKKRKKNLDKEIPDVHDANLAKIERQLEVARKLKEAAVMVISDFYKKRKPALEKMISDVFIRLTNNPQLYHRIEIKDDFSVRIIKNDGKAFLTTRYSPSAGASQIVATAIISGLSNFATRDAPIVIDTPLGRLDPVHKENVIRHYSQMGRQIIVLYQPSEMVDRDIQTINDNIASEWLIESVQNQPGTSKVMLARSNL